MNEQASSNAEGHQAELQVLLAEYKSHRDEIFKWFAYRHQAVGGYLILLSTLSTIVVSRDLYREHMCEILIAFVYLSLALLYVLFQFAFPIRSNARYIDGCLSPRIRELSANKTALEWESYHQEHRRKLGRLVFLLTKFNVEGIPHFVILLGMVLLVSLGYVGQDWRSFLEASCPWQRTWSFFCGLFWYVAAVVLWVWMLYSSSRLSRGPINRVVRPR